MNAKNILSLVLETILCCTVFLVFEFLFNDSVDILEATIQAIIVVILMRLLKVMEEYYMKH